MASEEHTYAIPDSTVVSLRLLCGPDFDFDYPDAVPFHVTEMDSTSTTDAGRCFLRTTWFRHNGALQRSRVQQLLPQDNGSFHR